MKMAEMMTEEARMSSNLPKRRGLISDSGFMIYDS